MTNEIFNILFYVAKKRSDKPWKKRRYRGDTPEWERVVGKSGKEAYECERMKAID